LEPGPAMAELYPTITQCAVAATALKILLDTQYVLRVQ